MPAVVLLGARQVGKTTLAKAIARDLKSIYLDLEAPEDLLKLSDPTGKYVLYGGDDEFPVGDDVTVISLPRLMEHLG